MDDITVIDFKGLKAIGIGYSRTHIWRLMDDGKFPRCFKLTDDPKSRVVWWLTDIRTWLLDRANRRI